MNEIWKDVVGWEGLYEVSNIGRVRSVDRYLGHPNSPTGAFRKGKILTPKSKKYADIHLWRNSKYVSTHVHRLVAIAFIDNPENKPEVNHRDGNKLNNHISNLEWVTRSENLKHAAETGLFPPQDGANNFNYKHGKYVNRFVK
jgi:hypothetical protein